MMQIPFPLPQVDPVMSKIAEEQKEMVRHVKDKKLYKKARVPIASPRAHIYYTG